MCPPDSFNILCSALKQPYCFTSNRVKSTLRTSSGTIKDTNVLSFFLDESLAFLVNVAFVCKTLFCNSLCTHHSLFTCLFPRLGLFLTQFLSILFSGSKPLKTGKSVKYEEIKRIQAEGMKKKLRITF